MIKKDAEKQRTKVSQKFISILAIVSIIGFISIVAETLFELDFSYYAEAFLMIIIGIGLVAEAKVKKVASVAHGLTHKNFTHLITSIIGGIAIVAGLFSLPQMRLEHSAFLAVKGIIAVIAIIIIIIQTWIID